MNIFKPDKNFVEKTKTAFLTAYREKFPVSADRQPSFAFRHFFRGLATGAALMAVIMSTAVYADQKNVSPDSFLYPLKRSQEKINLVLTNAEERPAFHLKLAERRLKEIDEIKQKDPESPKIVSLTRDLRVSVDNSLSEINGGGEDSGGDDKFKNENSKESPAAEAIIVSSDPHEGLPVRSLRAKEGLLSEVFEDKESENKDRRQDNDYDRKSESGEDDFFKKSGPSAMSGSTSSSPPGSGPNGRRDSRTKLNANASVRDFIRDESRGHHSSKGKRDICSSISEIIDNQAAELFQPEDSEKLFEKFQKKCLPLDLDND